MEILKKITDTVLKEDIEALAQNPVLEELEENASILITGATGLIGSQIVWALACHSLMKDKKLQILALVRSEEKARAAFGSAIDAGLVTLCFGDVVEPLKIGQPIDYMIHGASATSSRYFVEKPVETIGTALQGTQNILELARQKKVKKVVYLSSLEVYGTPDNSKEHITEEDYGYIDPMQVRSSYSEGKRMAECLCASYTKEYGVPVVVARLSQTFGPGVSYQDGRVFAEFARCAIEKRDIVLHTQGKTLRTYCYLADAVSALFCLMLRGKEGQAYNVTNMDTAISIRDMAQLVCDLVPEQEIQVKIDIPEDVSAFGYNPEMVIRLDSGKLQRLGWKPVMGMHDMFRRLIRSMRQKAAV